MTPAHGRDVRGALTGLPALIVCLVLCLVACDNAEPARELRAVILISCDTLRADRLGAYGYDRDVSPNLDAFAREAVVFGRAYATAPHTNPAMSSLFTSRMPDEIGVSGGNRNLMPAQVVTLPELLREKGIATAAIVSNWALRRPPPQLGDVGVAQGFEHFDDRMDSRDGLRKGHYERLADDTTDAAIEWLEQRRDEDERFLLWVHYQDPHGPYEPPARYAALFDKPTQDGPRLRIGKTHSGLGQIPAYQALAGEQRSDVYRNRYDGEIRFFDHELGRLLDWLRREGIYDQSLIVFTADHGESLGEHGYWFCHEEHLYDEAVRVPLIVRYAEDMPRPAKDELVGHLDLWPTILQAFGLPGTPSRGTSLITEELPTGRIAPHTLAMKDHPRRWDGVSDGRYRLLIYAKRPQLYDVVVDPGELHNLAEDRPQQVAALLRRYDDFMRELPAATDVVGVDLPLDEKTRRALQALGYVD